MNCPKCGGTSSRIIETIRVAQGLRRHRICNSKWCRHKYRTLERIEEWDHTIRNYAPAPAEEPEAEITNVIQLQQQEPKVAASKKFVAHPEHDALAPVCIEAQPLLVQWWNESRRSKHGSKATWTESAWKGSVERVAKLPAWQQVLLAKAGVEHGWQALKADYVKDELAKPTAVGRPMPKDPAMLAALEQWPSQTA